MSHRIYIPSGTLGHHGFYAVQLPPGSYTGTMRFIPFDQIVWC